MESNTSSSSCDSRFATTVPGYRKLRKSEELFICSPRHFEKASLERPGNALSLAFSQSSDRVLYIRIRIAKFDNAEEKTPDFVGRGHVC
jgi:hypothetical protein